MANLMKLTEENYYSTKADMQYMSVSQYKSFLRCPACELARLNGKFPKKKSTALLVGSYVDSAFESEESFAKFKEEHHDEIYQKSSKTPKLYKDFAQADIMIARARQNEKFMRYMDGEHQTIMTANLFGYPWKAKFDVYKKGLLIADLKTCSNLRDIGKWGYDIQGAVYQEIVYQNTGERLPFYLLPISKEEVPELAIIQIPQGILDSALESVGINIDRIMQMKNGEIEPDRCGECAWCKATKTLRVESYADYM